MNERMITMQSR